MNYQQQHLSGWFSALISAGKGAYDYALAKDAEREYQKNMLIADAETSAARTAAEREAGYAANREKLQSELDAQNLKRYLIIGGAVGVPLITLILLKKRGKK